MKTTILPVLFVSVCLPLLHAQPSAPQVPARGSDFVRMCSVVESGNIVTREDSTNFAVCIAFVAGVTDGADAGIGWAQGVTNKPIKGVFCYPEEAQPAQLVGIVLKYAKNHPEKTTELAVLLIMDALHDTWPCGK